MPHSHRHLSLSSGVVGCPLVEWCRSDFGGGRVRRRLRFLGRIDAGRGGSLCSCLRRHGGRKEGCGRGPRCEAPLYTKWPRFLHVTACRLSSRFGLQWPCPAGVATPVDNHRPITDTGQNKPSAFRFFVLTIEHVFEVHLSPSGSASELSRATRTFATC